MQAMKLGMGTSNSPQLAGNENGSRGKQKPEVVRNKKEERVTKMVFIMIVAFLIVWS
jgi:hypothetical protein